MQYRTSGVWDRFHLKEKTHITIALLKKVNEKTRDYLIKNGTEKMNLKLSFCMVLITTELGIPCRVFSQNA